MRVFFGKISNKVDVNQITGGYYKSARGSSWFGGVDVGDYVYLIGGGKIQFWQAEKWDEIDDKECLNFKILNDNLGIDLKKFTALNFLKLTSDVAVMTSRSARNKAFFQLETLSDLSVDDLIDSEFYKNDDIYRKTLIHESEDFIQTNSQDIQLFYKNGKLQLFKADFIDEKVYLNFRDNLECGGKGSVNKDKIIKNLKETKVTPTSEYTHEQLNIRNLYDTFFCEYKDKQRCYVVGSFWEGDNPEDQTLRFIEEGIWENGYNDKYIDQVKEIPVDSLIAIKSVFTRNKKGVMRIKARGVVVRNYDDGKLLDVSWEEEFEPFEVDFTGAYRSTMQEVKRKEHVKAIWFNDNVFHGEGTESEEEFIIPSCPKNQILFGPPGTGKTYNTINKAIEIVNPKFDLSQERKVVKKEYDRLVNEGQIVFTTFHQSMSYEDFIEGIKPIEPKGDKDPVHYKVEDGIFKRICKRANPKVVNLEQVIEAFKTEVFEENEKEPLEIKAKETTFDVVYRGTNVFYVQPRASKKENPWYPVNIRNIEKVFETGNYQGVYNPTYVREIISFLQKQRGLQNGQVPTQQLKPYVLIVDEINRGNVSQIFGELITLIEDDKRAGKSEALEVTLPYSKEKFTVPSNLYIIGTMNTADRSVEALDTALRRRFSFKEIPPQPKLIRTEGKLKDEGGILDSIDLPKLLETINERIERLVDKDHRIGHSYFLTVGNVQDLKLVFQNKIIPLLQEYFFGDFGKIGLVLGEGFFENKGKQISSNSIFANFNGYDSSVFMERPVYSLLNVSNMEDAIFKAAIATLNSKLITSPIKEEELAEQV